MGKRYIHTFRSVEDMVAVLGMGVIKSEEEKEREVKDETD